MKLTLSVIKADIGSIGGHIQPSAQLIEDVRRNVVEAGREVLLDTYVGYTGDDITILMTHTRGVRNEGIHRLARDAFAETGIAREHELCGAGRCLVKNTLSGNVGTANFAIAEMEIDERSDERFLLIAAYKADCGAYNIPLYRAFADPMYLPGNRLFQKFHARYTFRIKSVEQGDGDAALDLNAPEDLDGIAELLRERKNFIVRSIRSRASGEIAAVVSAAAFPNVAWQFPRKDDPVMLVRVQGNFPPAEKVLLAFDFGRAVAGFEHPGHSGPFLPVRVSTGASLFDGPPLVSCLGFYMKDGKLAEPVDAFEHPHFEHARGQACLKNESPRPNGFSERLRRLSRRLRPAVSLLARLLRLAGIFL